MITQVKLLLNVIYQKLLGSVFWRHCWGVFQNSCNFLQEWQKFFKPKQQWCVQTFHTYILIIQYVCKVGMETENDTIVNKTVTLESCLAHSALQRESKMCFSHGTVSPSHTIYWNVFFTSAGFPLDAPWLNEMLWKCLLGFLDSQQYSQRTVLWMYFFLSLKTFLDFRYEFESQCKYCAKIKF